MQPRRKLIPVQDSRSMRKAARNNKYLHSLRLKNIRSAVKKKLRNAKKRRKQILKKCATADKNALKLDEKESRSVSNSIIPENLEEIKNSEKETPCTTQQTDDSLAYDTGNKHTRSFSKKCIEMASVYIPCDYNYELSVRKPWPIKSQLNDFSVQSVHQSDQLKYNITDVMKDSLDLVLGYCFLYSPQEGGINNINHKNVQEEDVLAFEKLKTNKPVTENPSCSIENSEKPTVFGNNCLLSTKSIDIPPNFDSNLCESEIISKFPDSKQLNNPNIKYSDLGAHLEYPNLPEKCDDLNISEFLRPHLSPAKIKRQTIGNQNNPDHSSKNSVQSEFKILNLPTTSSDSEAILKINKDHSYARLDKERMLRESFLHANNLDSNYTLFVNKESSPKQYRNPKRTLFSNNKEGSFDFGSRRKMTKVEDYKLTKSDEISSKYKQITTKNIQTSSSKLQINSNTHSEMKRSNQEFEDRGFLKDLVMDTALLYSMLCGIEPEDIAFYIETRSMDPDQWAIDILDSIHVH